MTAATTLQSRRTFLRDLGHGAVALAVIGSVGCTGTTTTRATQPPLPSLPGGGDPLTYEGNLDELEAFWCGGDGSPPVAAAGVDAAKPPTWARFGAGHSSGYVLVRDGEATVVDTGQWCVPDVIEGGLAAVGLDWSAVGSIIVTHKHPDHWIGLPGAVDRAATARIFAGAPDIPHIASPRPIVAVGAGDRVMGLTIVPTPGHTPGHIAVHDPAAGVVVVGDAVVWGPNGGFFIPHTSEDLEQARESIRALAELSFDALLPGHGLPLVGNAWQELNAYLDKS